VVEPLVDFFTRRNAVTFLVVIMLLGFGDHLARTLMTPFLLKSGYTNAEVGEVTKVFGVFASIAGTLGGSTLIARFGLTPMMLIFAALQPLGAACYGAIAVHGKSHALLFLAVSVDNTTTAMVAAAIDTFLMALCNKRYSATQFALLMAATSLAGRFVGGGAGWFADHYGWSPFFFGSMLFALPSLALLAWKRRAVEAAYVGGVAPEPSDAVA
jgi:PAT family beta-lactamase induction signal transducer AmpG